MSDTCNWVLTPRIIGSQVGLPVINSTTQTLPGSYQSASKRTITADLPPNILYANRVGNGRGPSTLTCKVPPLGP